MTDARADHARLAEVLRRASDAACAFHAGLDDRPVQARDRALPPAGPLPETGEGATAAIDALERTLFPKLSGSVGPRFFGFVTGGATPAALAGDWLTAAVDQNAADSGDSAASALAFRALDWLKDLFALPRESFAGAFVTGATMANVMGLYGALQSLAATRGVDLGAAGLTALPRVRIYAGTPHSSLLKAASALGLGRDAVVHVGTLPDSEAVDPDALDAALAAADPDAPKIVAASVGTVTGTDFDDLHRLADGAAAHGAWLHADGAFGIFARAVPELAHLADGLERADSIAGDAHKWLNVPYDCGVYFTRDMAAIETSWGTRPAYLDVPDSLPPFMDRTVENSQRLRGLPVWTALAAYGAAGARETVRANCRQARLLADWIDAAPGFELLHPVGLNVVCFRAVPPADADGRAFNEAVRDAVNATGDVYLTPGAIHGTAGIRAAFSNWMTRETDVETLCAALETGRAAVLERGRA